MRVLVLFSGTGSIEKVYNNEEHDIRGLDFDNHFKPFYNVDILTWNYKDELSKWIPDYIHGSPVCKEFSQLKNVSGNRDLGLGMSLLEKTLEIIEYVKTINPNLIYTIENPKGLMRKQECMKPYKMITTSYCKYGYQYQKDTDFWFGGCDLVLRPRCKNTRKDKTPWCEGKKKYGAHRVRLGLTHSKDTGTYKRTNQNQMGDVEYFKQLRLLPEYKDKKYTDTYFRYRIPPQLCIDMRDCVLEKYNELHPQSLDNIIEESLLEQEILNIIGDMEDMMDSDLDLD